MKLCLIGDANSIHIRRWAQWFKLKGDFVSMISLARPQEPWPEYDFLRYVPPMSRPLAYTRRIAPIRKLVKKVLRPDIVHGHYMTGGGFYGGLSGCKNVVTSCWGSDIYSDAQKFWLKRQAIKIAMEHSKVVLADSDHLLEAAKKLRPKTDFRKVIFGIDTDLFKPNPVPHDKFRFLSIRATGGVYNSLVIAKAFAKANLDAELWMQEPLIDGFEVKDYVASSPELKDKVRWYSRRPYDQMPEIYNQCDVGVSMPSWDSSSTAMNECMACATPVICSDIPQNFEWIENGNGWWSAIDALALSKVMRAVYENQDWLKSHGLLARLKIVKDADFDTEMQKAEAIYKEVVDANR